MIFLRVWWLHDTVARIVIQYVSFSLYNGWNIVFIYDGNAEIGKEQSLLFDLFKAFD